MTARIPPELRRDFYELRRLNEVLLRDTEAAQRELYRCVGEFNATGSREEAGFWCKVAIRSLLGQADGLAYAMRRAALRGADKCGLQLSIRDRARLAEWRYDPASDRMLEGMPALLSTLDSLKLAFRYFPKLFGSEYQLDTTSDGWHAFRRIVRVRHNFTHPKIPEHLSPVNAFGTIHPAILWFFQEFAALFVDILPRISVPVPTRWAKEAVPPFSERATPWQQFFSDDDHVIVRSAGSRTLQYVQLMFNLLTDDTQRAMDLCKGSFASLKQLKSHPSQFAFRTYLRTLFSDIEGHISAADFQLEAARSRGSVVLDASERASLTEGELEERLASALTLWAREFGNDYVVPQHGRYWEALCAARSLRNRVTHPKKVSDLEISLANTTTLLDAHSYLTDGMNALLLNPEKWAVKGGNVIEAVSETQRSQEGQEE